MKGFISENFLLNSKFAETLYHGYAKSMPIIDYHNHLSPKEISTDKRFDNITELWLKGDHYKWRAMRTFGVDERYITGEATEKEKFFYWSKTVPFTIRNPLYHWTHMELQYPFGIFELLNETNSSEIYDRTSQLLKTDTFSVRNILRKFNVKMIGTTDDPTDSLEYHKKIKLDSFEIKVLPSFRPDKGLAVEDPNSFNKWIDKLSEVSNIEIKDFTTYIDAIRSRYDFFERHGCRISDHGLERLYVEKFTESEIKRIFLKVRKGNCLEQSEIEKFKSCMLYLFALLNHSKGWVQQFHIGALRNNNDRMMHTLGPDTGFDSIGDFYLGKSMSSFFNRLDKTDQLTKTILYNLNPRDNELFATMIGNYNDGKIRGKMQFGSAWWFLDQKDGITKQLNALSNHSLLSCFIGMLTDSRSFLSFSRHEYFRRILCDLIANDVEKGELPKDEKFLGQIVQDISYNNAKNYFNF
jgi:glucuronate isomerase